MTCMGGVSGSSVIDYKIGKKRHVESFEMAWDRLSTKFRVELQPNGRDLYMDTDGVTIFDINAGKYVKQYRMIRNTSNDWVKITLDNGTVIRATPDHPFYLEINGRAFVKRADELKYGKSFVYDGRVLPPDCPCPIGFTDVQKTEAYKECAFGYDVTTETEYFMVNGIESHSCCTETKKVV